VNGSGAQWRLGYRPGLDGLRAIAVLLVLAGHARVSPGGPVGVTLFFVLSGFLITVLLLEERDRSGRIDFRAFYQRRARRLLPALILFLAVVLLVTRDVPTVAGALFYVANWVYVFGSELYPIGHTWSLGVEEQFYVVWPALLVGLLAVLRDERRLAAVLVGIIVVSIALGFVSDPLTTYYGTHTRAHALALGALLAVALRAGWLRSVPWQARAAAWAGVAATVLATDWATGLWRTSVVVMPLAALVGTVIVADLATREARFIGRPSLAGIGRISYGLYLWHYSIFVFGEVYLAAIPLPIRIGPLILASLGAAVLSYQLVEKRFLRQSRRTEPLEAPISAARPESPSAAMVIPEPGMLQVRTGSQ
jgi:peptidoglycan/LPS O-acetylase OafA/YrhL